MNNGQPDSQGQRLLDSMLATIPEGEEMVAEASSIAKMMESPQVVYFGKKKIQKKTIDEVITIEDSDEEVVSGQKVTQQENEGIITIEDDSEAKVEVKDATSEAKKGFYIDAQMMALLTNHSARVSHQYKNLSKNDAIDVNHYVECLDVKQENFQKNSNGLYICPEISCGYKAKQRVHMQRHRRKHSGEKPFQCKICGKKFAQKYNCIEHIRTHTDSFKHKCPECEAKFAQKHQLKNHIMRFHYVDV